MKKGVRNLKEVHKISKIPYNKVVNFYNFCLLLGIVTRNALPEIIQNYEKTEASNNVNKKSRHILVVDDSAPVRRSIGLELESLNAQVDLVESGEGGLNKLKNNDYDLVFLDVILPGINGYDVCKKIKRDKNKKHIPIVMLTSKSSPFDKIKGKLSGCDAYLVKPVNQSKFQKILKTYLKIDTQE
jgi:CheY-like chemotaxis protein